VRAVGDPIPTARNHPLAQGKAHQHTNKLRDLVEDAARGRLYLPRELLEKHGIGASEPTAVLAHPNLGGACDDLAAIARASYAEAAAWLAQLDRRQMRPAVIMLEVYRRKLAGLAARGWRELEAPVGPSKLTKLWIAFRHGFL
jgi:phytoene/squalene synthetase